MRGLISSQHHEFHTLKNLIFLQYCLDWYRILDPWNFHEKILRIGGAGKWDFFEAAILNFLSRPFWIFFCFISVKNPALLYEVSFFSALWMVFPESWKRSCPNFYAHNCRKTFEIRGGWPRICTIELFFCYCFTGKKV